MQQDLFTPKGRTIVLEITGTIPSFKNQKMIVMPSLKMLWVAVRGGNLKAILRELTIFSKKRPLLITKPERQRRMEEMIGSIESQLLSAFQTAGEQTLATNLMPSLIASCMPADDCWTVLPELHIRGVLCQPGQEGATITIEPL